MYVKSIIDSPEYKEVFVVDMKGNKKNLKNNEIKTIRWKCSTCLFLCTGPQGTQMLY